VRLYEAVAVDGDLERGRGVWQRILPIKRLYTEQVLGPAGDLVIYRGMLRLWGLPAGTARAPLIDLDAAQLRTLEAYLAEHGLEGAPAPAPDSGVRA